MAEIKKTEVGVDISIDSKYQTLAGVQFPIMPDATECIHKFANGKLQYVQLKIGKNEYNEIDLLTMDIN